MFVIDCETWCNTSMFLMQAKPRPKSSIVLVKVGCPLAVYWLKHLNRSNLELRVDLFEKFLWLCTPFTRKTIIIKKVPITNTKL